MTESCFHCGKNIEEERISFNDKIFCCNGCKTVFEILQNHSLGNFYAMNKNAGVKPTEDYTTQYNYLDSPTVFDALVDFSEGDITLVTLKIPVMHCTSCIWLLESLQKIHPHINYGQVQFAKKTLQISFNHHQLKLSELAIFLSNLGYKPIFNLESTEEDDKKTDNSLLIKLAIAGFAFGNGMFFSLPEYLGGTDFWIERYKYLFRFNMILLSIPVVFYSASGYFQSAWYGLKNKIINIDVPIVLGILVLFFRSIYEVTTNYGAGYFDTLCGLIFFMLIGKFFQQRTYSALSYDRDYKSFYPIAVTRLNNQGIQENVLLPDIQIGDRILVRNQEIIPVDSILISGEGNIDNSFITGESAHISKKSGDKIFAGGKQSGSVLELEVIKNVNQSYLTQLWKKEAFHKQENGLDTLTNSLSQYFTIIILVITLLASIYWYFIDYGKLFQVISAILIVACPCAIALSAPFTFGHIMRILGKNQFYVKDTYTIEQLSKINTLVFDKTGTLTDADKSKIHYKGKELSMIDLENLKTLLNQSNHPLSKILYHNLRKLDLHLPIENFQEKPGEGYEGTIRGSHYKIGSSKFVGTKKDAFATSVYINKNGGLLGVYTINNSYRKGIKSMLAALSKYSKHILSGDNNSEEQVLKNLTPIDTKLTFNQSPESKLDFIEKLQKEGKLVAMIGDGLNDAGALKQSNVGIAIAENNNSFTPSSDIIMHGSKINEFKKYLDLSKNAIQIVKWTFAISLLYNIIGLAFAITGHLSPLVAAILMPLSSVTVILFTTMATWFTGRMYFR